MRIALRTALATAAVAGVALTPALTAGTAFAAEAPTTAAAGAAEAKTNEIPLVNGLIAKITELEPGLYGARIFKGDEDLMVALRAGTVPGAKAQDTRVVQGVEITLKGNGQISAVVVDDGSEDGGELGELFARQDLGHGYKGRVYFKDGGVFTAKILKGDKEVGTLKVDQNKTRDEAEFGGEIRVSLSWDGSLRATWLDDVDQENPLGEFAEQDLGHGYKGLVTLKDGDLTARILKGDKEVGRLFVGKTGKTRDEKVFGGEIRVTLHWNGELRATWLGGAGQKPGKTPQTAGTAQTTVVPKGGVAAGAEFEQAGDGTALVAAGAGAASLAAAGLGFVVLRRRAAGARV
ncbi:hypothetical protein [Streptomyces sp.]|uniref:hypothetical protein n=1 Tax=Streptomyces sp. TaxID=1931 RepID=UPI002F922CD0